MVEAAGFTDPAAEMKLSADSLVFATGQKAEDQRAVADVCITDKGTIEVDDNGLAGDRIFAAGDIVNGGQTVVEAVAEAKKAAAAMIDYLEGKGVK